MERAARRGRPQPRHLRQPHGPDGRLVDGDAFHRARERGRQPRVADPQGWLHALRRAGLPEGLPEPGGDREVRQRHRRLQPGQVHRLRLLHHWLPVRHPTDLAEGPQGLQVQPVFRPRLGGHGAGLREDLPDRRHRLRQQGGHEGTCRRPHRRPEEPRLRERRPVRPRRGGRHPRDVRAAPRRQAVALCRPGRPAERQPAGQPVEGRDQAAGAAGHAGCSARPGRCRRRPNRSVPAPG